MKQAAALHAMMLTALLISGCSSVPGQNILGIATGGGNASADSSYGVENDEDSANSANSARSANSASLAATANSVSLANTANSVTPTDSTGFAYAASPTNLAVINFSLDSLVGRLSESQYPAITDTAQPNPPLLDTEREAAAAQKHRTPRAKPPPHDFIVKPVATGRLTSGHGYRLSPLGVSKPRIHKGIDYAAPRGTDVYAAGAGIVERIYRSSSYGNYIRIRHADGYATAYAHLDSYAKGIKVGTIVKRWQTIGTVGNTGRSTGPHLHFELIHKGRFVDPLKNRANTELAHSDTNNSAALTQN